jgi:hypothetical protein
VSVFAVRTSLKSVQVDFVEERVRRVFAGLRNEANTRSEAGGARKAVNKNRHSFGSAREIAVSHASCVSARLSRSLQAGPMWALQVGKLPLVEIATSDALKESGGARSFQCAHVGPTWADIG